MTAPDDRVRMPGEQFDQIAGSLDQPDPAPALESLAGQLRQYRYDAERSAREARYITDLRTPKEPFGIAIGSIRTGHNEGDMPHPAWCSADECTANDPNFPHHLSAWTIVYPGHAGETAMFVRLIADVADAPEEPPTVEIVLMRPGQCTSIEGYELRGDQALLLAQALGAHGQAAVDPGHWNAEVRS